LKQKEQFMLRSTFSRLGSVALMVFLSLSANASEHQGHHEMQHGFILSNGDHLGSHLVATGHHSRQAEIQGVLLIPDAQEALIYKQRKQLNSDGKVYFLFQAQSLNLPTLQDGQIISGHIVESTVGKYEPKNIIIKQAQFKIERVLLNLENPFFSEE
jgi:hypothetical protein